MLKAIKVLFDAMDVEYKEISENEIAVPSIALAIPVEMDELLDMDEYPTDLPLFSDRLFVHIKQYEDHLDWLIPVQIGDEEE